MGVRPVRLDRAPRPISHRRVQHFFPTREILVSHELSLDEAFDNRDDGWTKVVLHPDGSTRSAGASSHHTLQELRREAKAQGIEGRSHMNKQQLERALES